jgi:hypothetical protein
MGIGITLLTVYGKEIGEFIMGTKNSTKAIEEQKKIIEEKIEVEKRIIFENTLVIFGFKEFSIELRQFIETYLEQ